MKIVLYSRLSKQHAEGQAQYGMCSQEADLQNWIKANAYRNIEIVGEYGEFFSGRGDFRKRVEFTKALAKCKETGATLVLNKPDRLARDVESGSYLLNKYKIIFTNYPDADMLTKQILLTVAQAESDNTSVRVTASLAQAKKQGVLLGAQSPIYQANRAAGLHKPRSDKGARRIASVAKVKHLKPILESLVVSSKQLSGTTPTLRSLAQSLTSMEVLTSSGKSSNWNAAGVQRALLKLEINL